MKTTNKYNLILMLLILVVNVNAQLKKDYTMPGSISLSGGVGLKSWYTEQSSYTLNANGIFYFTRITGVRINVDLTMIPSKTYSFAPDYYEEGGNRSILFLSVDFLAGSFKPESRSKSYFFVGAGVITFAESDRVSYSSYGTYTQAGESQKFFALNLGGGFSNKLSGDFNFGGEIFYGFTPPWIQLGLFSLKPKISYCASKNLEVFAEPQYLFPIYIGEGGGFFVADGFFTVKAGVTWNLK